MRRALPRLSIGLAAVQIFLSLGSAAVWPLAETAAQDDPSQWPADQKVEKATERDKYYTAIEAKEFGLVDEVLTKIKVAPATTK